MIGTIRDGDSLGYDHRLDLKPTEETKMLINRAVQFTIAAALILIAVLVTTFALSERDSIGNRDGNVMA